MTNLLVIVVVGFIGSHIAEFFYSRNDIEQLIVIDNLMRDRLFIPQLGINGILG